MCDKLRLKTLSPTPTPPVSPRPYAVSLRGSFSSLSRDSSPQGSPHHRGSLGNFRSSLETDISKSYIDSRNGVIQNRFDKPSNLKLPPWDQASAEFYFARSRDLLTKAMTQVSHTRGNTFGASGEDLTNGVVKSSPSHQFNSNKPRDITMSSRLFDKWRNQELDNFSGKTKIKNESIENSNPKLQKTNMNPSVLYKKEVPLKSENPHQFNNVTLRKCGSKGHLRRRSYNDRYLSSTSSDSSDSLNMSGSERQMNHRLKTRKQRRGGSFSSSHTSQLKSSQPLINSPPPQNSFLNSVVSPRNASDKNNLYSSKLTSINPSEPTLHQSLNNLSRPTGLMVQMYDPKWPERARDSSSLTFTSSNSSSLNWEEYLELDREFLSCSNCPPSPAPQV